MLNIFKILKINDIFYIDNDRLIFYDLVVLIHTGVPKRTPIIFQVGGKTKMTTITRIDPFRELATFFENWDVSGNGKDQLASGTFVPAVDVYEDEHSVVLKLEVPGINEEDLKVSLENNTLTITGERKFEKEEKEENFHRIERRYGSFTRTFRLPNAVDSEKVEAGYDKGILKVTLAKKAEAKPRQIKVATAEKTLQA
jgi:HSP20 family protein